MEKTFMAFFKKPQKSFLSSVELIEKDYKNFYEAMLGELSTGSHDTKETVIHFPDRTITIRSASGLIKTAFDSKSNLSLADRLYWVEPDELKGVDLAQFETIRAEKLIEDYTRILNDNPKLAPTLRSIFEAYTTEVIQRTIEDFGTHEKIRTEIIGNRKASNYIQGLDFFQLTPKEIEAEIAVLSDKERSYRELLGFEGIDESEVSFVLNPEVRKPELSTDVDRFVFSAAESTANLVDVRRLAKGFIWVEVLESFKKFAEEGLVHIELTEGDDALPELLVVEEDALDEDTEEFVSEVTDSIEQSSNASSSDSNSLVLDLDDMFTGSANGSYQEIENPFEHDTELENKSASLELKPLEGVIVEMVNNPGEEYVFGSAVEEDDGSFMYELLNDETPQVATAGIKDSIEDDVREIVNNASISIELKNEVFTLVRQNTVLEAELISIEKYISDNREHYSQNVEVFEELKYEKNYIEVSDDSEVGEVNFSKTSIISEKQATSNNAFFTVSQLEEERYHINSKRADILEKLSVLISEIHGEKVQGILHRIDLKLAGIDGVHNIAFHNPKDDENEYVDQTLLEIDSLSAEEYEEPIVFTRHSTPTFFNLVSELNFNPFAEV